MRVLAIDPAIKLGMIRCCASTAAGQQCIFRAANMNVVPMCRRCIGSGLGMAKTPHRNPELLFHHSFRGAKVTEEMVLAARARAARAGQASG